MSWERHINRARWTTGVTVGKDQVGPIPNQFESVSFDFPGLFGIYEGEQGLETIRILESPQSYRITVESPTATDVALIESEDSTSTGLTISPETKRKLAVGGLAILGALLAGESLSESKTAQQQAHRVFISHSWKYEDQFEEIKTLFDDAWAFEWYDHSVPSDDAIDAQLPNHLRSKLKDQIRPTHFVLVLAGMYATHSTWMEEEIVIADEMGKPIIGVRPPGNEQVPRVVKEHATEIVDFDRHDIRDAIRKHA